MKFYYFPVAPNPTKVRTFIREKGIQVEERMVNLRDGEHRSAEHLARNPGGALPVLELDNGEYIAESLPMMEYLEELYPDPVMIGSDPLSRLRIREYERSVEKSLFEPIIRIVHSTNSPLGLPVRPEISEPERAHLPTALARVDARIGDSPFAAGDSPTMVDCTLFAALYFGEFFGVGLPAQYENLRRWFLSFKTRPSAQM
jgi:glutathione S-transferase